ncbi:hypothetical protein AVV13_gp51 [Streptomyces phage SF1]|nr:hypothetical protein AVV13_gp51 [Streptomyces phage SF1]AKY02200.1 hypothetical protein SF1_510 [Streptomyces phage SF1]
MRRDLRRQITYLTCLSALAFVLAVGIMRGRHG